MTSDAGDDIAPLSTPMTTRARWPLRGFLTAIFIFLAGPPIGATLLVVPLYFISGQHTVTDFHPNSIQNELESYLSVSLLMVMLSHFVGGVQALLSAVWLGIRVYLRGTFSYGHAVLVAVAVSIIWALRFGNLGTLDIPALLTGEFGGGGLPPMLVLVSVASALICRWLLRVVRILPQ